MLRHNICDVIFQTNVINKTTETISDPERNRMLKLLVLLACVGGSFAFSWPVVNFGGCPNYSPIANIDLNAYMGVWYEIERFPASFEDGMKCIYATYTLEESEDGDYVRVNNTGEKSNGERSEALGKATQPNPPEGAFIVSFDKSPMPVPSEPNYNVMVLDPCRYVLIYSCTSFFGFAHLEYAWILSREPTLSHDVIASLKTKLAGWSDPSSFATTDQTDCSY